jgi:hypothetical protein
MNFSENINPIGRWLITVAGLFLAAGAILLPGEAHAVVNCAPLQVLGAVDTGADSDADGFTDFQECNGISTVGTNPVEFKWCGSTVNGVPPTRDRCLDPDSRDLFVILARASASVFPEGFNAFLPVTFYGVNFTGLNALGLAVHQLNSDQADLDRFVAPVAPLVTRPKAVRVSESLDANGTILGNCQWGTPLGLDGCVIYTQRAQNFIASTCGSASIQTPAGAPSTLEQVVLAYSTYLVLHESGHSLGGLTGDYNSRFGGYHYKPGAGLVMEQAVTYTVKGGKCTFYISPNWNVTLDPPQVRLQ